MAKSLRHLLAPSITSTDVSISIRSENSLPRTPQQGPDRRHLQHTHVRVSGDHGLGQKVIEPHHAPLLPMDASSASRKPAVQLTVVISGATSKETSQPNSSGWSTVATGKKHKAPSVIPPWAMTVTGRSVVAPSRPANPWGPGSCEIPDRRSIRVAPEVKLSAPLSAIVSSVADGFVEPSATAVHEPAAGHPTVSQKKSKKYEREARRKAKKMTVQDEVTATIDLTSADQARNMQSDANSIDEDSTRLGAIGGNNRSSQCATNAV
jgi:hypothetical protein